MNPGTNGSFLCQAVCYPSCNYTWAIDGEWIDNISVLDNEITIHSQLLEELKTLVLVCKATNSVSGLFAEATETISVVGKLQPKTYQSWVGSNQKHIGHE